MRPTTNLRTDPQPPIISGELPPITWKWPQGDQCSVLGCTFYGKFIISRDPFHTDRLWKYFGIPSFTGRGYKYWETAPFFVNVCIEHEKELRQLDGITLGYRKRNGKITVHVEQEHW